MTFGQREATMQRKRLPRAVFLASVVAALAAAAPAWLSGSAPAAGAAAQQGRSLPVFEVDPAWPTVPDGMKLGAASSIAIDADDNVWVLHRPLTLPPEDDAMAAPPVVVFDAAGNFIKAWGGPGEGYEWPQREHGLHIDHEGFVWLGGNNCPTNGLARVEPVNDDQMLKFTQDGTLVLQIGRSNRSQGNADTMNLNRPADQQVHPPTNELFVADGYGNRRVAVFDAETGVFKRMWGAFGEAPVEDNQCQVQAPASFPDPGPAHFNVLHAIRVSHDGLVYAADREHRRVQVFALDGTFVGQVITPDAPFARNLALSADAEQQFLYVGGDDGIVVVDRATLEILGTLRPEGILGTGHHIATDSQGNLYLGATGAGMQKLTFKGMSDALPADVHAGSRNRLAGAVADASSGPADAAAAIRGLGSGSPNLRWDIPLGRPLLELAILATAREHDQPFEWSLHEMEAVAVGLDPAIIDVVRHRQPVTGLDEHAAVIIEAGREIFGEHHLSAGTYRRLVSFVGERDAVDLVGLMARYAATAARLTAFNQQMPPGWPQFLPLPFTPPDDIDPQSRSRLPPRGGPAERVQARASLYGRTLSPEGTGPGHIRRHAAGREALEANVPRPLLDLAALVTARAYDVQYAWTLTELAALENGLDPAVIDVVRHERPVAGLPAREAALITFGREIFGPHTVSPETYERAVDLFGKTNLVDLVDLMADHVADATLLIAFDQQLPPGQAPLLTMP